jgi:hypothetical protein
LFVVLRVCGVGLFGAAVLLILIRIALPFPPSGFRLLLRRPIHLLPFGGSSLRLSIARMLVSSFTFPVLNGSPANFAIFVLQIGHFSLRWLCRR